MKANTALAACSLLAASSLTVAGERQPGVNFQFAFQHQKIAIETQNTFSQLSIDKVELRYGEVTEYPLRLDLILGSQIASQTDNPDSAGIDMGGQTLGLALEAMLHDSNWLQLSATLELSYHDIDGNKDQQQLTYRWRQANGRVTLALPLFESAAPYLCSDYISIDGDTLASGNINHTLAFKNRSHNSHCAGIKWLFADDGIVGFEANSDAIKGGRLYFGKLF